jgi:hypothetical protein
MSTRVELRKDLFDLSGVSLYFVKESTASYLDVVESEYYSDSGEHAERYHQ